MNSPEGFSRGNAASPGNRNSRQSPDMCARRKGRRPNRHVAASETSMSPVESFLNKLMSILSVCVNATWRASTWLISEYIHALCPTGQWSQCRKNMHYELHTSLQEDKLGLMGKPMANMCKGEGVDSPSIRIQNLDTVNVTLSQVEPSDPTDGLAILMMRRASSTQGTLNPDGSGEEKPEKEAESVKDDTDHSSTVFSDLSDTERDPPGLTGGTMSSEVDSMERGRMSPDSPPNHLNHFMDQILMEEEALLSRRSQCQRFPPRPRPSPRTSSEGFSARKGSARRNWRASSPSMINLIFLWTMMLCSIDARDPREYDERQRTGINFTAFNCKHSFDGKWRGLDLTEVGSCPDGDTDYLPPQDEVVSLVQTHVPVKIELVRCDIRLSKKASVHEQRVDWGLSKVDTLFQNERVSIPGSLCRDIALTRTFTCSNAMCNGQTSGRIGIELGKRRSKVWYTRGGYDPGGFAQRHNFAYTSKEKGTTQYFGVEEATLDILIEKYPAFLDIETRTVWSETLAFRANYDLSSVSNDRHGTLTWDTGTNWECSKSMAVIATNRASVRRLVEDKRPGSRLVVNAEYAGAIVIVKNTTDRRAAGIVVSEFRNTCIDTCAQTNIPRLLICIETDVSKLDKVEDRVNAITTMMRINQQSQGTYLELNANLNLFDLHTKMQEKICDLDVRTTKQDFAFLLNAKSAPYALRGMSTGVSDYQEFGINQTAFTVSIRGSTAYFTRCSEENVEIVPLANCSLQIPVIRSNGQLSFADAINHHIIEYPTWVDCDQGLPVQYRIRDKYYCHTPGRHSTCPMGKIPIVLKPSIGAVRGLKVEDMPVLGDLLLNARQQEKVAELIEVIELGPLIVDDMTEKVMHNTRGTDSNGHLRVHFGLPLTNLDFQAISFNVAYNMFFLFRWLGNVYLNLFGVFVIFSVIKHFTDTGLRMYFLYKRHGFGPWILRACWGSIWAMWALPKTILLKARDAVDEQFKRARDDALPPVDAMKMQMHIHELRSACRDLHESHKKLIRYNTESFPTEFTDQWVARSALLDHKLRPSELAPPFEPAPTYTATVATDETRTSAASDSSEDDERRYCIICGERSNQLGNGPLGIGGRCRQCQVPRERPSGVPPDRSGGNSPSTK